MATTFDLTISCPKSDCPRAERVLAGAHELITKLERELSEYDQNSCVYLLNRALNHERILFSKSALSLLKECDKLKEITRFHFNPTAKSAGDFKHEIFHDETHAWKSHDSTWLGFGAIGKGYALDRVRILIEQNSFENFGLSAGGSSIILSGFAAPGVAWSFGWSWKQDLQGRPAGILFQHSLGQAIALGISGTHEKGEHIVYKDSRDVTPKLLSAFIAHPSATQADALSTALFSAGMDEGMDFLNEVLPRPGVAVIEKADESEAPRWNGVFNQLWGLPKILSFLLCIFLISNSLAHAEDQSIDLGELTAKSFTPYLTERNSYWALLPLFFIAIVVLHLRKNKKSHEK